jgi:hypothetical protein
MKRSNYIWMAVLAAVMLLALATLAPASAQAGLSDNGTFGWLGIGTDSPTKILHVTGSGTGSIPLFQRGVDSAGFIIERTPTNRWAFGVNQSPTLGYGFVISTIPTGTTSVPRLIIDPSGNVTIPGTLTATVKNFKIDHPLDPTNKYLYHSSVESPDMLNVYAGNAVLDGQGRAAVQLPSYFQALNRDYTYKLTCIGGYSPVYIVGEIADNRFEIAGGQPGLKVSWQVTGIRQDAYAKAHPLVVEQEKPAGEKGFYLHPIEWGQPLEKGIR